MIQSRNILSRSPNRGQNSLSVSQIQPLRTPFTFQSQENSCNHSQVVYSDKQFHYGSNCFNDGTGKRQDSATQDENIRQNCQRQYKMKLESVIKGYELKITKQQQTFQLAELKYKQQIQYLQRQIKELVNVRSPSTQKDSANCSICSNGQVITHMKNMLESIETDHKDCIKRKAQMNDSIINLESKVAVLEGELERCQNVIRKVKDEVRSLRHEKDGWEREKRQKQRMVRDLEREYHVKEAEMKEQIEKTKDIRKKQEQRLVELLYNSKIGKENEAEQKKTVLRQHNSMKSSTLHNMAVQKCYQDYQKVPKYYKQTKPLPENFNYRQSFKDFNRNIPLQTNTFDTFRPKSINKYKYEY